MSRFYKVRISAYHETLDINWKCEFETFMINPAKDDFDSFMTEICARLPELFYQPFKLCYHDRTRELITIFNWLDFGIFYMQNINNVFIMKSESKSSLHFRTLWSMPTPTPERSLTYNQFMTQPASQLKESTCFDFIKNSARTPLTKIPNENPTTESFTNTNVNDNIDNGPLYNSAANMNPNYSFDVLESENIANFHSTSNGTSSVVPNEELNASANRNISNALSAQGSDLNLLMRAIQTVQTERNVAEAPKKKNKNKKKTNVQPPGKKKITIVEPSYFIGKSDWDETFAVGDNVEVCFGDWEGLHGRIIAIDGNKIKVIGNLYGGELDDPLVFEEHQLLKISSGNHKVKNQNQNKEQVAINIQNEANKSDENGNGTVNRDEAAVQKEQSENATEVVDQKTTEINSISQEDSLPDTVKCDVIKNILEESNALNKQHNSDENSTEITNLPNPEATNDNESDQEDLNAVHNDLKDAIIDVDANKETESSDSVNLISTEKDVECTKEPEGDEKDENVISIESGQESPTSEWTFVETAEYAESPITVNNTGTLPKKSTSKEDVNGETVKRRMLPKIPKIVLPGHIDEALSIMIAMGFDNDRNQLSQLLQSVDGNITSAIDLLDPQE